MIVTILQWLLAIICGLFVAVILLSVVLHWRASRIADRVLPVLTFEPKNTRQIRADAGLGFWADLHGALLILIEEGWAERVWVKSDVPGPKRVPKYARKRLGSRRRHSPDLSQRVRELAPRTSRAWSG